MPIFFMKNSRAVHETIRKVRSDYQIARVVSGTVPRRTKVISEPRTKLRGKMVRTSRLQFLHADSNPACVQFNFFAFLDFLKRNTAFFIAQ